MSTTSIFTLARQSDETVIKSMRKGIAASAFAEVAKTICLSGAELADKLNISTRTLNRKKSENALLSLEDSQKIIRVARIRNFAADIFSADSAIAEWLAKPAPGLSGRKPIDMLDTDIGARQVEGLLVGIAHGNVI